MDKIEKCIYAFPHSFDITVFIKSNGWLQVLNMNYLHYIKQSNRRFKLLNNMSDVHYIFRPTTHQWNLYITGLHCSSWLRWTEGGTYLEWRLQKSHTWDWQLQGRPDEAVRNTGRTSVRGRPTPGCRTGGSCEPPACRTALPSSMPTQRRGHTCSGSEGARVPKTHTHAVVCNV